MQSVVHWLAPGAVLLATLALGVCAHELLHLVPLRLANASYTVTLLPANGGADSSTAWTTLQNAFAGGLVRVEVTHVPPSAPGWAVRIAAILPVALALPLLLVAAGVLPNPLAAGDRVATAALLGATACGLPSPADWSVVWHGADRRRDASTPEE